MAKAAASTGISLNSDFYMKNFYRYNRNAIKASNRKEYSTTELSYEDTRALKRAIAKLGDFEFDEFDNEENLRSTIRAFAETYNLTMESTSVKGTDTYRLNKQLKELTDKYGDKLEDIGITIEEDGKLKVNKNIFEGSSLSELKEVFDKDGEYEVLSLTHSGDTWGDDWSTEVVGISRNGRAGLATAVAKPEQTLQ